MTGGKHPYPCPYDDCAIHHSDPIASNLVSNLCTCSFEVPYAKAMRLKGIAKYVERITGKLRGMCVGELTALQVIEWDDKPAADGVHLTDEQRLSLLEQVRTDLEEENREIKTHNTILQNRLTLVKRALDVVASEHILGEPGLRD